MTNSKEQNRFVRWLLQNPYLGLMDMAWKYSKDRRPLFFWTYFMFVAGNLLFGLTPLLWGWFINQAQVQGSAIISSVWIYVGLYLLIHFGEWALHGNARVFERTLAFHLSKNYLEELYHKTLQLPVKWHQENHSGATINRIRKAYEALSNFFQTGFRYLEVIFSFLFSFGAMLYFSPSFGFVAILFGGLIVWIILKFDRPYIKALNESNEKQHIVSSTLFDSLSNIITVITLRLQKRMQSGLEQKVADVYPPFKRQVVINEWKWFVVDTCVVLIYFTMMVGYVYQEYQPGEVFLIGGLVALMTYVERFVGVFHQIAWLYTQVVQYHTDVMTANKIIEAYDQRHLPEPNNMLGDGWTKLHLQDVSFEHQPTSGKHQLQGLEQVEMILERGKKIAVIGESGSGKSTLLALIRGLYEPKPESYLVRDGAESYPITAMADQVTLFPQEPEIFENTIEYNITLGLPYQRAEVEAICEVAHFTSVVKQLPKGFESNIKEKGVNLSGGQKQRLALARGILAARHSHIVLLDEPTSSVDPKTEVRIYERLFAQFPDKVFVSALHRLHLLVKFDYIYVMDKGRVISEGSFEDLMENSPAFQELWRHQEEQY